MELKSLMRRSFKPNRLEVLQPETTTTIKSQMSINVVPETSIIQISSTVCRKLFITLLTTLPSHLQRKPGPRVQSPGVQGLRVQSLGVQCLRVQRLRVQCESPLVQEILLFKGGCEK